MNGGIEGSLRPSKLEFEKVVGYSTKCQNQVAIERNMIAYLASGGVVVTEFDDANKPINQRFFFANVNDSSECFDYYDVEEVESIKDQFGFVINQPKRFVGNGMETDFTNDKDGSLKLKERVKTINCIAISPNKRLLAVGEIGYQPRILIFSLAPDLSNNPIALIYEHTFGIHFLQFSPDLKYLCSLGLVNDGFINIWKISPNSFQICSSNKCSSVINRVLWYDSFIITLGLRLIKVWKFDSEEKALKGKNVVLRDNLNSNFIDGDLLNDDELLLITDCNELLLLLLNYEDLKLINLESPNFEFQSICIDHQIQRIWFGDKNSINSYSVDKLKPFSGNRISSPRRSIKMFNTSETNAVSFYKLSNLNPNILLFLNESKELTTFNKTEMSLNPLQNCLLKNLQNVKPSLNNKFIAYSKRGIVNEISELDLSINLTKHFDIKADIGNELTAFFCTKDIYLLGDKYGTLTVLSNSQDKEIIYQTKSHSSTINDIVFFEQEGFEFIASISRDRMIQLYYKLRSSNEWDILQTIPTHNGNVTKIEYYNERLFACSSDRSLSVHKILIKNQTVTLVQDKLISMKATPIAFKINGEDLFISTNDKIILLYDLKNYELKKTIKLVQDKLLDSLLVETFTISQGMLIVACSDKSLRIYNSTTFKPLCMTWGHVETILGLLVENKSLISISSDGCIFKWKLVNESSTKSPISSRSSPGEEASPFYAKVQRKIIPVVPLNKVPTLKAESNNDAEVFKSRSPSPRLTNATLKRIEARKLNAKTTVPKSTPSSPSVSLAKPKLSSTKPLSIPNLPISPSKYDYQPPTLPESPTRPRVVLGPSPSVNRRKFNPKINLGGMNNEKISSIINHLDQANNLLRAELETLSPNNNKIIIAKLNKMLNLLIQEDDEENREKELLEKYSNNLLRLFEMKLNQQ